MRARIHERGQAAYLCIPFSVVTREEGWPPFLSPPPPALYLCRGGPSVRGRFTKGREGGWREGGREEGRQGGRNSLNISFEFEGVIFVV